MCFILIICVEKLVIGEGVLMDIFVIDVFLDFMCCSWVEVWRSNVLDFYGDYLYLILLYKIECKWSC